MAVTTVPDSFSQSVRTSVRRSLVQSLAAPGRNLDHGFSSASLALWACLTFLIARAAGHFETVRTKAARVWNAWRIGAGLAWLYLQPWFAELRDSAEGWLAFSAASAALFIQVSTPDATRDWIEVMETSIYPKDRPVRAAIYRRVSTGEQQEEGHSLDEQLNRADRYVKDNHWVLTEVYTDVQSGSSSKRPSLRRLEKAVLARSVDVVVVDRIDRLYRDLKGLLRIVKLFGDHGVQLVSVSERVGFDTHWGRLVLMVLGALAEYYLAALSAETRKGKRARARAGLSNSSFRFGVCNGLCSECTDPNGQGYCPFYGGENRGDGKVPIWHPIESAALELMFRWYSSGEMSDQDIAHRLNVRMHTLPNGTQIPFRTKGIPGRTRPGRFTDDAVRYLLTNSYYCGLVGYGGVKSDGSKQRKPVEQFESRQGALVDKQTWNLCQEIRKHRRHRPQRQARPARVYPLSRLLFCDRCKGSMRGFSSNGANNRYYGDHLFREQWRGDRQKHGITPEELEANLRLTYDHQPNVAAETAEKQVQAIVERISLPFDWKRAILAYLTEEGGLSAYQNKKLAMRERMARANERYLSSVAPISRWDLERIHRECLKELDNLERMVPPGTEETDVWQYLEDFGQLWQAATWEEQNKLLGQLCSAIFVQDQEVVRLVAYPAFKEILSEAARQAVQAG